MLIPSSLYRELGGLNTTLTESYASIDLCLRAQEREKKVIFGAHSQSLFYGDSEGFTNKDELRPFNERWGTILTSEIEGR
jgi:uracil-DNA glycosylase